MKPMRFSFRIVLKIEINRTYPEFNKEYIWVLQECFRWLLFAN
jgi:hypothetical protein